MHSQSSSHKITLSWKSFLIPPVLFLLGYGVVRKITFSVLFCVLSTDLCIQIGNWVQNQNNQECLLQQYQCSVSKTFPSKHPIFTDYWFTELFIWLVWTWLCFGKFHNKHSDRSVIYSIRIWGKVYFLLFRKC